MKKKKTILDQTQYQKLSNTITIDPFEGKEN